MAQGNVTEEDIAEVVRLTAEAASAFIRGDIRRYLTFIKHADDYTLMAPWGGEPRRGFDASDEALEAMASYFTGGEAELEVVETYASGDMVVLVAIERQHGQVGGRLDQDWSLRVTLVFRRDGSEWRLAHRHADPLVHSISQDLAAAIARGDADTPPPR
jgi:ketosteroid isomerase-like protein